MRRAAPLLSLLLAGCSTAPIADLMDWVSPGRLRPGQVQPYGGVCIPQGGPVVAPAVPTAVPVAPTAPVPGAPPSPFLPPPSGAPPVTGANGVPLTQPF
jgi:hypothetical protein